ncbi:MAG: PIN domain-containing protein [Acidobacteriota bacterium]
MSLVFLDTQILVWGVKKEFTEGQEEMVAEAGAFIDSLRGGGDRVAISAVVFGELLLRVPTAEHAAAGAQILRDFIVIPYDAPAAIAAANVWRSNKESRIIDEILEDGTRSRAAIRADCQIIGTALSRSPARIVSQDLDLCKLARNFIDARAMPRRMRTLFS